MKRILIIKLWALGDILMATPLLTALHGLEGGAEITWVADAAYAPLLDGHPLLREVVGVDTGAWRRMLRRGRAGAWLAESRRLRREMAARRFDVVLNFHPEKWWTRVLCAAPVRVGLSNQPRRALTRGLYTRWVGRTPGPRHSTDRYLDGARALGLAGPFDAQMVLRPSARDAAEAAAFLAGQPQFRAGLPALILHPGTSQAAKCWPPESFAAVAAALSASHNVVITGSAQEAPLACSVADLLPPGATPPVVAAGKLARIGLTTALVAQARAVVTGDTFLLHVASALGTPVVGVYGSTRPRDNAPLRGPRTLLYDDSVPCAPCYKGRCPLKGADFLRCQRAVTPARVLSALSALSEDASATFLAPLPEGNP